ncbi:sperm motility kinase 2B-like [Callospermophilus lateralis]
MPRESSERSAVRRVWRDLAASSSLEEVLTGRYEPLGVVGQGSFAKVFLARHILTGTKVAVKVLRKGAGATLSWVLSELDIMKGLEHPHVVQLLEIVETPGTAYVVMEHMAGGQLGQHIPEVVGLWEDEARMLFGQVASAVGYCHAQGIAHRDVKADNVLLDAAGHTKLCDFSLACRFRAGEKLGLLCGTVAYWAPELHRQEPYDGPAVDVWSLGVLLFLMLTGCIPFTGASYAQTKEQVLQARYHLPFHLSDEAQSLVSWMLTLEPVHRPTLQQILGHPWLSQDGERCPSPPAELLPKRLDTSILLAMLDLGYGLQETWVSVATGQFDEAMATYFLLHCQKTRGGGLQGPAEAWEATEGAQTSRQRASGRPNLSAIFLCSLLASSQFPACGPSAQLLAKWQWKIKKLKEKTAVNVTDAQNLIRTRGKRRKRTGEPEGHSASQDQHFLMEPTWASSDPPRHLPVDCGVAGERKAGRGALCRCDALTGLLLLLLAMLLPWLSKEPKGEQTFLAQGFGTGRSRMEAPVFGLVRALAVCTQDSP